MAILTSEQTKILSEWREFYWNMEFNDVIPFWEKHAPDSECGGFIHCVNRDGSLITDDKAVWIQGRAAWLFAHLYNNVEQKDSWLKLSDSGIDFIDKYCFDTDGRMFFAVTRDGKPLRKRRYMFSETFAIVAFAENAIAHKNESRLKRAMELFEDVVRRYYNPDKTTPPKGWPGTRPLKGHAMPMILLVTSRILRAAANEFSGYENYCTKLTSMINDFAAEVVRDFYRPEFHCLLENVTPDGKFSDTPEGRIVNPGHAIETSWFLMDEAFENGNEHLRDAALKILEDSLEIGWDKQYGGILYFVDCKGFPADPYEHDMKLWWPHNEACIATLAAFRATGDEKWLKWHERVFEITMKNFPDPEFGEWFGYFARDWRVTTPIKGNMWKGIFHVPRALLKCASIIDDILTK